MYHGYKDVALKVLEKWPEIAISGWGVISMFTQKSEIPKQNASLAAAKKDAETFCKIALA